MGSTFYDIHMHAMDLSHPNLMAFVSRIRGLGAKLILGGVIEPLIHEQEQRLLNLLTVMENCIDDYFCLMEYFLKNKEPLISESCMMVDGMRYDTILLTPLIMDFGLKNIECNTFYNMATGKPVVEQTADVLRAIAKYCSWELKPSTGGSGEAVFEKRPPHSSRLFEIYPFMGINTLNYSHKKLESLLNRFFGSYRGKRKDLFANMGIFGSLETDSEDFRDAMHSFGSNVFAGIKLYPPLGFNPWPDEQSEREKVRILYHFCQAHQIPLTAHCSNGGYAVVDDARTFSNPLTWEKVLEEYPRLKLNLAHFGRQDELFGLLHPHEWRETIIRLTETYPQVYTDISCLAFDDNFYRELSEIIGGKPTLSERVLFGSDYMINLQWIGSYNEYIDAFRSTGALTPGQKHRFCSINPEKFLFH